MPAPWRGRSLSRTSTHVSVEPQKHLISEAPAGPVPPAGGTRVGENLLLLTHDESLIEALVNVVPPGSLSVVADEAALGHHLLSGHAGVVFIDAGALDSRPGMASQLTQRLHNQLPDVVLVVAGDGAAQSELAALVTDGTIYRFVHKPVSAQRVKLFVDAAWRKRDGVASGMFPVLTMSQLAPIAPMTRPIPWPSIGAAAVVVAAAVAWFLLPTNSPRGPEVSLPGASPGATQGVTPAAAPSPAPAAAPAVAAESAPGAPPTSITVVARRPAPLPAAQALGAPPTSITVVARRPTSLPAPQALGAPPTSITVVARRVASLPAAPRPERPVVTAATIPAAEADVPPEGGPPSSTPPLSEARDRDSVAAIILHREYAPDPEFPELAREQDLSGYVDLEFTVNADGSVADVTVLKSRPAGVFEKSAVAAVRQWRYRPPERDGVVVSEHARLRLNFAYK
jgi:TonB family protein